MNRHFGIFILAALIWASGPAAFSAEEAVQTNAQPREFRAKHPLRERVIERRKAMTDAERKAKREEIKGRFEKHLTALRDKKAKGTLNARESKRLERLETIAKRFQAKAGEPQAEKTKP